MNFVKSIIAGFAGAGALNILHETLSKVDSGAPRIDLVGEEAVEKSTEALNLPVPTGNNLYGVTLAGDIITNASYFAAIGMGGRKFMLFRAIGAGVSAGIAALSVPEAIGLNEKHINSTDKRKLMTIGYYVFGALVTAGVLNMLTRK